MIEALVAMAVMAFGMLGMVGVQATLRLNSDVAKQRSEALRLAQRAVEDWRSFSLIDAGNPGATPPTLGYADIASIATRVLTDIETGPTNTQYSITQEVGQSSEPRLKTLRTLVTWSDRTGGPQRVELNTAITGIPPELAGALLLAANVDANGIATRGPLGRHRSIPVAARDLTNGSSGFMPPGGGTAVLLFDNLTGVVKLCETTATSTAGLTAVNITACSTDPAQFLSGSVRFDDRLSQTAATAEAPNATVLNLDVDVDVTSTAPSPERYCFDDAPTTGTAAASRFFVNYYCVVLSDSAGIWSGTSFLIPRALDTAPVWTIAASGGSNYEVCRYTTLTTDTGSTAQNPQHPRSYSGVVSTQVLTNQNFLVIAADASCPIDTAATPASGNFVNSNTLQHQP